MESPAINPSAERRLLFKGLSPSSVVRSGILSEDGLARKSSSGRLLMSAEFSDTRPSDSLPELRECLLWRDMMNERKQGLLRLCAVDMSAGVSNDLDLFDL